jgi:hypothetical protein
VTVQITFIKAARSACHSSSYLIAGYLSGQSCFKLRNNRSCCQARELSQSFQDVSLTRNQARTASDVRFSWGQVGARFCRYIHLNSQLIQTPHYRGLFDQFRNRNVPSKHCSNGKKFKIYIERPCAIQLIIG